MGRLATEGETVDEHVWSWGCLVLSQCECQRLERQSRDVRRKRQRDDCIGQYRAGGEALQALMVAVCMNLRWADEPRPEAR